MTAAVETMRCRGSFTHNEHELLVVTGRAVSESTQERLLLHFLVDPEDGVIIDGRYQLFGSAVLISFTEIAIAAHLRKHYIEARSYTTDALLHEAHVGNLIGMLLPGAWTDALDLVIKATADAMSRCSSLPLPKNFTPIPTESAPTQGLPNWQALSHTERLALIERVLDAEIRPYIAMDAGGIEVLNLVNDHELIVRYQGSCTSCFSSVGATLGAITEVLHKNVYPELVVTPNLDNLSLSPHT